MKFLILSNKKGLADNVQHISVECISNEVVKQEPRSNLNINKIEARAYRKHFLYIKNLLYLQASGLKAEAKNH